MDINLKDKLAKLNPEKLAAFLEKEAMLNPEFMGSVQMLANHDSPDKILSSILTEIKSLSNSQRFIDWRQSNSFAQSLARIIANIETLLLPNNPKDTLKALDAFLRISPKIMERVDDSNGNIGDEFRIAIRIWGETWNKYETINGQALAEAIWDYLDKNDYGLYDDIITSTAEALKRNGVNELERLVKSKCANDPSRFIFFHILRDIALLKQSPEAYLNAFKTTGRELIANYQLELVRLFIDTSRVNEAILLLESVDSGSYNAYQHLDLLIEAHTLIGSVDKAQSIRWDGFVKQRRKNLFKDYLEKLTDLDEKSKAIDQAINIAVTWDTIDSISMLLDIGCPDKAATILRVQYNTLQGHQYYTLKDFAEVFTKLGYILEAILIYRRLTEDILARAQSKYYHHAINYLEKSKFISKDVKDWDIYPPTATYFNQLKELHRRKPSFMQKFETI